MSSSEMRSASAPRGTTAPLVIVTPTAFERRGLGTIPGHTVMVCGPGPGAVRRWAAATRLSAGSHVVVAGVAGGLHESAPLGSARIVSEVRGARGERLAAFPTAQVPWIVVGVDAVVASPGAKRALATASGAGIVDMESHAFVREANARQWHLTIIRGVSDAVDDELPADLESMLTPDGRLRPLRTALLLARQPRLLPTLRELGRRSHAAMREVRSIVDDVRSRHGA